MDTLLSKFQDFSVSNIKLVLDEKNNKKIVATMEIKQGDLIGKGYINGSIKYFWEVYPDNRTFTINNDIVLDVSNDTSNIKFINECPYYFNSKLEYDTNYASGEIYNFKIVATKNIFYGDEIILQYDNAQI